MMERYQDNLKDKLIEFQGQILYVVDQAEYNSDYYVYTFNMEKYEKHGKLEINILKKIRDGQLEVITDNNLFEKILNIFGMKTIANEINKLQSK